MLTYLKDSQKQGYNIGQKRSYANTIDSGIESKQVRDTHTSICPINLMNQDYYWSKASAHQKGGWRATV